MIENNFSTKKGVLRAAIITALLLLVPLTAMQFTNEVNWTAIDFIVMGVLLFTTGLVFELAVLKIASPNKRILAALALFAALFLIWAQLAVGLIVKIFTGF